MKLTAAFIAMALMLFSIVQAAPINVRPDSSEDRHSIEARAFTVTPQVLPGVGRIKSMSEDELTALRAGDISHASLSRLEDVAVQLARVDEWRKTSPYTNPYRVMNSHTISDGEFNEFKRMTANDKILRSHPQYEKGKALFEQFQKETPPLKLERYEAHRYGPAWFGNQRNPDFKYWKPKQVPAFEAWLKNLKNEQVAGVGSSKGKRVDGHTDAAQDGVGTSAAASSS